MVGRLTVRPVSVVSWSSSLPPLSFCLSLLPLSSLLCVVPVLCCLALFCCVVLFVLFVLPGLLVLSAEGGLRVFCCLGGDSESGVESLGGDRVEDLGDFCRGA